jgi:voltage-gated potassium channel
MTKKIYLMLEGDNHVSKIINSFITTLIVLNILAVILDSYSMLHVKYRHYFNLFEIISIIIFSIEYILRVISSPYKYSDTYNPIEILHYIITPLALIDLLSILPFYLPLVFRFDLRVIRIFRVFRLVRILKIKRYSKSLDLVVKVLKSKKTDLILTFFVVSVILLLCGSIMYYVENEVQPDVFPNIIDSTYWALKTMVFLGYDTPPLTVLGKFLGIIITLLGLGWIALPISIISSGFIEEIGKTKNGHEDTKR